MDNFSLTIRRTQGCLAIYCDGMPKDFLAIERFLICRVGQTLIIAPTNVGRSFSANIQIATKTTVDLEGRRFAFYLSKFKDMLPEAREGEKFRVKATISRSSGDSIDNLPNELQYQRPIVVFDVPVIPVEPEGSDEVEEATDLEAKNSVDLLEMISTVAKQNLELLNYIKEVSGKIDKLMPYAKIFTAVDGKVNRYK